MQDSGTPGPGLHTPGLNVVEPADPLGFSCTQFLGLADNCLEKEKYIY